MRLGTGSVSRSAWACSAAAVVALAGCGSSSPKHHAAKPQKPQLRVTLTAQSHSPHVGKPWHYEVHVTENGRPVPAHVRLQIVYGGAPVATIGKHRFTGTWQETIGADGNPPFPARAKGLPLVFEATVTAAGKTVVRKWPITVR